jgi:hypothetical protein
MMPKKGDWYFAFCSFQAEGFTAIKSWVIACIGINPSLFLQCFGSVTFLYGSIPLTPDPDSNFYPTPDPVPDPTLDPAPDPTLDPAPDPTPDLAPDPTPDPAPDQTPDPALDPAIFVSDLQDGN